MISIHDKHDPAIGFLEGVPMAELHAHMGFGVSSLMLWDLAHRQGLKLPTKNFREFQLLVNATETYDYEAYLMKYDLPELIQSSAEAIFAAVEYMVSAAFFKNNTRTFELRFNPLLRNRNGQIDVDYIIVFALQAMERVMLKFPIKAGIILEMDRRFDHDKNAHVVEKAIKYRHRGVIGVDVAGPVKRFEQSEQFRPGQVADLFAEARKAGLGLTFHTGEATGVDEMWEVVNEINPDRIGHGLAAVEDEGLLREIAKRGIVLENCPTSNLLTHTVNSYEHMREIFEKFEEFGVKYTINTDGAESLQTSLLEEYLRLVKNGVLDQNQLLKANQVAHEATFITYDSLVSSEKADAFTYTGSTGEDHC